MTDLADENIRFWEAHEQLQPWLERGLLDFAQYDATAGEPLQLLRSGDTLSPEHSPGPVFLIANYLFDTIPAALFRIQEGEMLASQARLQIRLDEVPNPEDPSILPQLAIRYRHVPIEGMPFPNPTSMKCSGTTRKATANSACCFPWPG
jgi:hypothetical protein